MQAMGEVGSVNLKEARGLHGKLIVAKHQMIYISPRADIIATRIMISTCCCLFTHPETDPNHSVVP